MIKNQKLRKFLMLDKRRKRTTFLRIFAKSAAVMLIVSGIFASFTRHYIEYHIYNEADREIARQQSNNIQRLTSEDVKDNPNLAEAELPLYTFFELDFPVYFFGDRHRISVNNIYDDNNAALSVLLDENGEVLTTSKRKFVTGLSFGRVKDGEKKPPESGWYVCPKDELEIPELNEFYEKFYYQPLSDTEYVDFDLKSAYVNKSEHWFIPHEVDAKYTKAKHKREEMLYEAVVTKTETYTINADVEGYELIEVNSLDTKIAPFRYLATFQGTDPQKYDWLYAESRPYWGDSGNGTWGYSGMSESTTRKGENDGVRIYYMNNDVRYNGQKCTLCTVFAVKLWTDYNNKKYIFMVGCFTAFALFLALLYSWRKNVLNKADYAFEDYQRALTNNLAHDLKTPLAAIGGYAENLMEMNKDSGNEKEMRYLSSIMDNVSYTDSIIKKTLRLAEIEQLKKPEKTDIDLRSMTESAFEKYMIQLDERNISLKIEGESHIKAEKATISDIVENLVSNAVKYTRNNGSITVTLSGREYRIVNDVEKKAETEHLKEPYIKGDTARSNKSGSGLGLSIADCAAERNGCKLVISCDDSRFTAIIKL